LVICGTSGRKGLLGNRGEESMRFLLSKVSDRNTPEERTKYERLGFKFKEEPNPDWKPTMYDELDKCNEIGGCDENVSAPRIELKSLEELLAFVQEYGDIIVYEESGQPYIRFLDEDL